MGLSVARALVQLGGPSKILLLDQFPLPHTRGSSHGHSRIYRVAYHHPVLSEMAKTSVEEWHRLETEFNVQLLDNCGVLITGLDIHLQKAKASLQRAGSLCDILSKDELARELPAMSKLLYGYPPHQNFLLDRSGGVMNASLCLHVLLKFCRQSCVEIREEEKVLEIQQNQVRTTKALYFCRSVIITAGPWAPNFLANLGLHVAVEPRLVAALYWKTTEETDGTQFCAPKFIPLLDYFSEDSIDHIYTLPSREYPNCVKVGHQRGGPVVPDQRDMFKFPKEILNFLRKYIECHLPLLDHTKPSVWEPCMYTQAADDLYIIDRHPQYPDIIIATGFSGNGFKMGPIVGKIVAKLALKQNPNFDLSDFSLNRFRNNRAAL